MQIPIVLLHTFCLYAGLKHMGGRGSETGDEREGGGGVNGREGGWKKVDSVGGMIRKKALSTE
jgi:hypothetical protein